MARKARHPLVRFLVFLGMVVGGILVLRTTPLNRYLQPDDLTGLLETMRQQPSAPLLFVIAGVLLTSFGLPASVVIFVGGAVFGTLRGALLSFVALYSSALLCYLLARTLAHDLVVHLLGKRLADSTAQPTKRIPVATWQCQGKSTSTEDPETAPSMGSIGNGPACLPRNKRCQMVRAQERTYLGPTNEEIFVMESADKDEAESGCAQNA